MEAAATERITRGDSYRLLPEAANPRKTAAWVSASRSSLRRVAEAKENVFQDAVENVAKLKPADWDAMRTATIQLRNGDTARKAILALARLSPDDLRAIR